MPYKAKELLAKYWDTIILGFLILVYTVVLGTLSILRHNAFASNFDLSNMDHTMWNTLYGNFFSLRFEEEYVSRLSIHADFILILLSPLYFFWDDVRLLLLTQTLFLAIGGIPAYLISLKLLKNKIIALSIVLAYLLNPQLMWTNIYDFHPVSLVVPFFLFAFYFALIKRWLWYGIFVILAVLTKENQSLNIAMLGLAVFFAFKQRMIGAITFVAGITWFVLMVFVVMPEFSENSVHWALQEYENDSIPAPVLENLNPLTFVNTFLFERKTQEYYALLLKPFGFITLLGLPWMLLSLPSILINVLRDTRHIIFHYGTGIIPSLVIATAFGFSYLSLALQKIRSTKRYAKQISYIACIGMLLIAIRFNYHYSPLPTTPACWCFIYNVTEEDREFEKALQRIPPDASVTASLEVRPHVNHRIDVWSIPSATSSAEYIALIRQNRIVGNYEQKDIENRLIPILLSSEDHQVVFKSTHFYLFKRKN